MTTFYRRNPPHIHPSHATFSSPFGRQARGRRRLSRAGARTSGRGTGGQFRRGGHFDREADCQRMAKRINEWAWPPIYSFIRWIFVDREPAQASGRRARRNGGVGAMAGSGDSGAFGGAGV